MPEKIPQSVYLATPRAFCAGVERAINMTDQQIASFPGQTVFVYHEIVHNGDVVRGFEGRGVTFVDDLTAIPDAAPTVFSAHGVTPEIRRLATEKDLPVLDATCPLVKKVHDEVIRFAKEGFRVVLIGHHGHDETIGILGEAPDNIDIVTHLADVNKLQVPDPTKVAILTQTTLSVDDTREIREALKIKFPNAAEPAKEDICFATQNRQSGVRAMVDAGAEAVYVIGAQNSSNSNRLKEVALAHGAIGYLMDDASLFQPEWVYGRKVVGITAGASAPEFRVLELVDRLKDMGVKNFLELEVPNNEKNMRFKA